MVPVPDARTLGDPLVARLNDGLEKLIPAHEMYAGTVCARRRRTFEIILANLQLGRTLGVCAFQLLTFKILTRSLWKPRKFCVGSQKCRK